MKPKYYLTSLHHTTYNRLSQICALISIPEYGVRVGDIGGYVYSDECLSHYNSSWVDNNSCVFESARVVGDAYVAGYAMVKDFALVQDNSIVLGNSIISGFSHISGFAMIKEHAIVQDGFISDFACIDGNAMISNHAVIKNYSHIGGNAKICCDLLIHGRTAINGEVTITNKSQLIQHKMFTMYYDSAGAFVLNAHFEDCILPPDEVDNAKNLLDLHKH